MEEEILDFEPEVVAPTEETLDFEPEVLDFEPETSGGFTDPTAEELEKYSKPQDGREKLVPKAKPIQNEDYTEEEAFTIPSGDMDVKETIQFNRDEEVANPYREGYQSGNVIVNKDGKAVPREVTLGDDFEVTTDMYERSENPSRLYELLQEKSEGTSITGSPIYKGKVVPTPGNYSGLGLGDTKDKHLPTITGGDLVADTIRDSGKNTIVTLAATVDELANAAGIKSNLAQMANENIANAPEAQKTSHALAKDAMRITASVVAGNKLGQGISRRTNQGSLDTKLIAATAALAVETLTNNPDEATLITGDNALVELMEGVPIDENGRYSEQVLSKKLNQLVDTMATAGPLAAGVNAVAKAGEMSKRIVVNALSDVLPGTKNTEKRIAREILEAFGVGDEAGVQRLQKYLNEHAQEVIAFSEGKIDDAVIERSSMSAIAEGAGIDKDHLMRTQALQMEKAVEKEGDASLLTKKQQPMRVLGDTMQQASDSRGGMDAVKQVHDSMANQAIDAVSGNQQKFAQVKSDTDRLLQSARTNAKSKIAVQKTDNEINVGIAKDLADGAIDDHKVATEGLQKIYESDQAFANTIDQLSKETGIDVANKFRNRAVEEVLPSLVNAVKRVKDKKNGLYASIPEGAMIDEESFVPLMADAIQAKALPKDVQEALTKQLGDDPEDIAIENLDFKKVYKMLPKINKAIMDLSQSTSPLRDGQLKALHDLRENINVTQMEHLINSGDEAVANAARDAVN
jgi:hypothetical protein